MSRRNNSHQRGFALILSLLALVLLTTMGLALSNSTGVELQISTNQRWSESAKYNSEAGIEYGRSILMAMPSWAAILPDERTVPDWGAQQWNGPGEANPTGNSPWGRATRDFENWKCDEKGYGIGYGVVVDDGGAGGPEEYRSQIGGATLNGSFTLWVRRPVAWTDADSNGELGDGNVLQDYPADDVLILVSEGVAPYTGLAANTSAFGATNRAVYTIETLLARTGTTITDQSECNSRQGQAGGSASGGNSSGCVAITQARQVREAATGGTAGGTFELK